MLISVPQYIDVEDKIVGPITAKQLGWLISMGVTLLILWNTLSKIAFYFIGIPLGLLFLAFAFYKPYGQPLGNFVIYAVFYFFRPKVYIWKRTPEKTVNIPKKAVNNIMHEEKKLTQQQVSELAELLDSRGMQASENVVKLLKEEKKK